MVRSALLTTEESIEAVGMVAKIYVAVEDGASVVVAVPVVMVLK